VIRVKRDITIAAPVGQVFALLRDPHMIARLSPSTVVDRVEQLPGGLYRVQAHMTRPNGKVHHRQSETLGYADDLWIESMATTKPYGPGQLETHAHYQLAPVGEGTLLTTTASYTITPRWYAVVAQLLFRNQLELGVVYAHDAIRQALKK
jgi:uncharacterized protein YndB with AHSA1/START domain